MKKRVLVLMAMLVVLGCKDRYREGRELIESGQYLEAVKSFKKLTKQRPNDPVAWNELGYSYSRLELYSDAEAAYRKAVELDPDYFSAQLNLGVTLQRLKRLEESEKCLQRALELDPKSERANISMAWTLYHLRNWDPAEDYRKRAVELSGGKNKYEDLEYFIRDQKEFYAEIERKNKEKSGGE